MGMWRAAEVKENGNNWQFQAGWGVGVEVCVTRRKVVKKRMKGR